MVKSLIEKMSNDMGIQRYKKESDKDFFSRLIYSGISEWIRYSILDKTNEDDKEIKSKIYIRNRGKEILDNYLKLFPECEPYFYMDYIENGGEHPINIIREQMLVNGDLIQLENGISLPSPYSVQVTDNLYKVLGFSNKKNKHFGISRLNSKTNNSVLNTNEIINSEEFISKIFKNNIWEKITDITDFEVFNPNIKQSPYKCWQKNLKLDNGFISIARLKVYDYDYYFFKKEKNTYYIGKMNETLKEFAEYRRMISILRYQNSNSLVANAVNHKQYVELNLYARLPKIEENFLLSYSWPKRNINDRFYYIIPIEVWGLVKTRLDNLKIQVQEN